MDIQFFDQDSRFKLRTSALIIEDDHLLLTKNDHDDTYYTVGGKVEIGESTVAAVEREALEETGVAYKVDRLVYVQELFYEADFLPDARHFHDIIFHYLMKPMGQAQFNQASYTKMGWKEEMVWVNLDDLDETYTYPRFLSSDFKNLPDQVQHLIGYEEYK